MSKDQIVDLMLDVFQEVNVKMAENSGMTTEEIKKNLESSTPSIYYMLSAVYDKLVEQNLLK